MKRPCLFWNVQRLFDPAGLPVARSLGVTRREWTAADYRRKVGNVATCLREATGGEVPAIVALVEIESLRVQVDLRERLGWDRLAIVDELAPEPSLEGLDVTLMVDRAIFDASSVRARSIALDNGFATRDLLEVRLRLLGSGTEVVLVVLHWPSRLISEGESLRFAYSVHLQRRLTSVLKLSKADVLGPDGEPSLPAADELLRRWNTPCVIMGDFNDEPYDPSVRDALRTTRFADRVLRQGRLVGKALVEPERYLGKRFSLYNPCWNLRFTDDESVGGTYYRSEWRSYDQVLLSHGALLDGSRMRYVDDSVAVVRCTERLGDGGDGDDGVEMTTRGGAPRGFDRSDPHGASDHFPLRFSMDFTVKG